MENDRWSDHVGRTVPTAFAGELLSMGQELATDRADYLFNPRPL